MATVMFIPESTQNRFAMRAVINYCQQEYKTFDSISKRRLISGVNCDGANSFKEFMATKKVYGKDNGIFFYHYAQSFSPSEKLTPEQAHEIALEFAEKAWEGHEVLVTTHCDASHIHSHFVINSVGFESGMKLCQTPSTLKKLRKLSDEICIAHGLSALQPYEGGGKRLSTREYRARMKGESWKQKLANDIDKAMEYSGSKDEFIRSMSILGYHMTWTDERKYLTFHCPNGKSCRDIKLHDEKYLKENIERELLQREFPDSSSGEKQSTGWEDSRELYEQHLRERALTKAESQGVADSYPTVIGNVGSLAGAVSKIVNDDSEDQDERRKRIEAEENGSALGTVLGLGIGMVTNAAADSQDEMLDQEPDYEQEECKTREEILHEIFGADDYDYDDYDDSEDEDEDEGFSMTL
ncbi:relaxase/mobilization nuclease domain-containing protein [Ruminococcus sp.]|uniref:relaxase/mobilization nuclease domain-containing protein n=1 Tax=Ruminococcus sp. TaxID=41978 RepID=UPI002E75BA60|nr:relaxase/mobilization nuclease domain-containing protein [Ruminococcus sp.]MEE1262073.1 relaxase/mobilization nuclease domain-containing protein [Ruminococcus sp.]